MEYKDFSIWLGHFKIVGHPQTVTVAREIPDPDRFRIIRTCPQKLSVRWGGMDIQMFGVLLVRKWEIDVR